MANFALLGVYLVARLDVSACGFHIERIFHRSKTSWDGVVQEPLRDVGLERWCIFTSTRALPEDECVEADDQAGDHHDARHGDFERSFGRHERALNVCCLIRLGRRDTWRNGSNSPTAL